MSPVEPRPLVIGTMGLPSSEEMGDLCFLPKRLAAFDSAGANRPPLMAPRAERNARRLQSNFFKFICSFPYEFFSCRRKLLFSRRGDDHRAADDFDQGIPRNPFNSHARAGRSFAGREIGS